MPCHSLYCKRIGCGGTKMANRAGQRRADQPWVQGEAGEGPTRSCSSKYGPCVVIGKGE